MKKLIQTGIAVGLSLTGWNVAAQDSLEMGTPAQEGQPLPTTFSAGIAHQFSTDIDDAGEFDITRFNARLGIPYQINEEFTLKTAINYELADYEWDDMKSPWSTIHTATVAPVLNYKANDQWTIFGAPVIRLAAESGADVGDSLNGGAVVGANYLVSETLTIGGGLGIISQIEDDATLVPVITADWRFADHWKLQAGFFDVATRGVGAQVIWDLNLDLQASFGGAMHKSRFRLDDSPRNKDGVGEEKAFTIYAKLAWQATENILTEGFVGIAAGGELRVEDDGGDRPGGSGAGFLKEDYDPAALLGLRASFKF